MTNDHTGIRIGHNPLTGLPIEILLGGNTLVSGPTGSGKTTLLREAAAKAALTGTRTTVLTRDPGEAWPAAHVAAGEDNAIRAIRAFRQEMRERHGDENDHLIFVVDEGAWILEALRKDRDTLNDLLDIFATARGRNTSGWWTTNAHQPGGRSPGINSMIKGTIGHHIELHDGIRRSGRSTGTVRSLSGKAAIARSVVVDRPGTFTQAA